MNASHSEIMQKAIEMLLDIDVKGRQAKALGAILEMLISIHSELKRQLQEKES